MGGCRCGVAYMYIFTYIYVYINFESNLRSNSQMDPSYPANIQPHTSVPSWQILLIKRKKSWTHPRLSQHLQQTQTVLGQSEFFMHFFGGSFYMAWKLYSWSTQNFVDWVHFRSKVFGDCYISDQCWQNNDHYTTLHRATLQHTTRHNSTQLDLTTLQLQLQRTL